MYISEQAHSKGPSGWIQERGSGGSAASSRRAALVHFAAEKGMTDEVAAGVAAAGQDVNARGAVIFLYLCVCVCGCGRC